MNKPKKVVRKKHHKKMKKIKAKRRQARLAASAQR